jgi:predicted RNase H-like HicB family nuclease
MMKKQSVANFQVIIGQDEDGIFVADVPAIPGCHSQGETYEEALHDVEDVIRLCLSVAETDKVYRRSIDWPEEIQSPRLTGIVNIPVALPVETA